jgi:hypothetical protein
MTHPAVGLLAIAMLALALLLAARHPATPPAPAKTPQLTTTTLRPPASNPVPAGPPTIDDRDHQAAAGCEQEAAP